MKNIKVVSFDVEGTLTTTDFSYAIWFESIQDSLWTSKGFHNLPNVRLRYVIVKK